MADLNYIQKGSTKYYPVDKEARKDIIEIKDDMKQIANTGNATSWDELLNKPFYEIVEVNETELFKGIPTWQEDVFPYCNIGISTQGKGVLELKIDNVQHEIKFNESVTAGDYRVQLNENNLYLEYLGSGTPSTNIELKETLSVITLKKLDRKFIDMGYNLERYAFSSFASNKEVTVSGIWDKVKNKDFVFVETTTGKIGKLELVTYSDNSRKFHMEYTDTTTDKATVRLFSLVVSSDNKVKFEATTTYYENSNYSNVASYTVTGILTPDYEIGVV